MVVRFPRPVPSPTLSARGKVPEPEPEPARDFFDRRHRLAVARNRDLPELVLGIADGSHDPSFGRVPDVYGMVPIDCDQRFPIGGVEGLSHEKSALVETDRPHAARANFGSGSPKRSTGVDGGRAAATGAGLGRCGAASAPHRTDPRPAVIRMRERAAAAILTRAISRLLSMSFVRSAAAAAGVSRIAAATVAVRNAAGTSASARAMGSSVRSAHGRSTRRRYPRRRAGQAAGRSPPPLDSPW